MGYLEFLPIGEGISYFDIRSDFRDSLASLVEENSSLFYVNGFPIHLQGDLYNFYADCKLKGFKVNYSWPLHVVRIQVPWTTFDTANKEVLPLNNTWCFVKNYQADFLRDTSTLQPEYTGTISFRGYEEVKFEKYQKKFGTTTT